MADSDPLVAGAGTHGSSKARWVLDVLEEKIDWYAHFYINREKKSTTSIRSN